MKAILVFNLPEDRCEFEVASKAMDWALTVIEIEREMRDYLHYDHKFSSADEAIEKIKSELCSILESRNLSLDMIE